MVSRLVAAAVVVRQRPPQLLPPPLLAAVVGRRQRLVAAVAGGVAFAVADAVGGRPVCRAIAGGAIGFDRHQRGLQHIRAEKH